MVIIVFCSHFNDELKGVLRWNDLFINIVVQFTFLKRLRMTRSFLGLNGFLSFFTRKPKDTTPTALSIYKAAKSGNEQTLQVQNHLNGFKTDENLPSGFAHHFNRVT